MLSNRYFSIFYFNIKSANAAISIFPYIYASNSVISHGIKNRTLPSSALNKGMILSRVCNIQTTYDFQASCQKNENAFVF